MSSELCAVRELDGVAAELVGRVAPGGSPVLTIATGPSSVAAEAGWTPPPRAAGEWFRYSGVDIDHHVFARAVDHMVEQHLRGAELAGIAHAPRSSSANGPVTINRA